MRITYPSKEIINACSEYQKQSTSKDARFSSVDCFGNFFVTARRGAEQIGQSKLVDMFAVN